MQCLQSADCPVNTPVCDEADQGCRACLNDADCASTVCDLAEGTCVAEADIAYASPGGIDSATCTKADPCSIKHAFAVTTAARRTVKLGPGNYTANLLIANKAVTVDGFGAMVTASPNSPGEPAFQVSNNASLSLRGLGVLAATNSGAIRCEGANATLALDQVNVEATGGSPVFANPCSVIGISRSFLHTLKAGAPAFFVGAPSTGSNATVDRSVLDGGDGVFAAGTGAIVHVTNSVISNQSGADGAFSNSFFGSTKGVIFVSFSTILNSLVKCNTSVACTGGGPNGLCIDNSIIFNSLTGAPTNTVTGVGCIANFTLVAPQQTVLMGANNKLGVNPLLVSPSTGDVHLLPGSAAIDAADPTTSNPIDLDGTARPQGTRSDLGALERPL